MPQQARPLAAEALRSARDGAKVSLDYFVMDPGADWSLLVSGPGLRRHIAFVTAAITRILELYRNTKESTTASVILIGHGLGGTVAKMAAMSLSNPSSIQIILTLNTQSQSLVADRDMESLLAEMEAAWSPRSERTRHVSLVTISDNPQVSRGHEAADVRAPVPRGSGGLWCEEMVARVNRALVTTVSGVTRHVSLDTRMRNGVLRFNILEGGEGRVPEPEDDLTRTITLDKTGYWADILKRQFSVAKGNVTCDHYTSVRVAGAGLMVVDSLNLPYDWVFGCLESVVVKNTRMCGVAQSLARFTSLLPGEERRLARLDMEEMGEVLGYTHIVLYTPADSPPSQVTIIDRNDDTNSMNTAQY